MSDEVNDPQAARKKLTERSRATTVKLEAAGAIATAALESALTTLSQAGTALSAAVTALSEAVTALSKAAESKAPEAADTEGVPATNEQDASRLEGVAASAASAAVAAGTAVDDARGALDALLGGARASLAEAAKERASIPWGKGFQKLWVAGTMGALFSALAASLPGAASELSWEWNFSYTVARALRYGYVIWLLVYFFVADVRSNHAAAPVWRDIVFDVAQSAGVLVALWGLGFVTDGAGYAKADHRDAMILANGVVFGISVLSLMLFGSRSLPHVDTIRIAGAVLAFLAIVALAFSEGVPRIVIDIGTTVVFLGLAGLLWAYIDDRTRTEGGEKSEEPTP